jgi:hypothetical protein
MNTWKSDFQTAKKAGIKTDFGTEGCRSSLASAPFFTDLKPAPKTIFSALVEP